MLEENKALVRRSWATDNTDVLDEVYAPDALWHLPELDIHGVEEFKEYLTPLHKRFPRPERNR